MKPYYDEGGITIYHGDCREVLPGVEADAIVTDPPYGIGTARVHRRNVERFSDDWDAVLDVSRLWNPEVPIALFASHASLQRTLALLPGPRVRVMTWQKSNVNGAAGMGNPWLADVEFCAFSVPSWPGVAWSGVVRGARSTGNPNWQTHRPDAYLHPTQKPVGVMRHVIGALGLGGQLILDPFMGSGTTLRAAKDLGRRAIGIEIEERYCEIAAKRLGQEVMDFGAAA